MLQRRPWSLFSIIEYEKTPPPPGFGFVLAPASVAGVSSTAYTPIPATSCRSAIYNGGMRFEIAQNIYIYIYTHTHTHTVLFPSGTLLLLATANAFRPQASDSRVLSSSRKSLR